MGEIKDVEEPTVRWAQSHGWLVYKLNVTGRRGVPDRLFMHSPGICVFIEFKAPGKKASRIQQHHIDTLTNMGISAHVIDNTHDAIGVLLEATGVGA